MRVNELSKELGKTNKEVLEILQKNQFDVKSHASSISDDQAAIVRRTLGPSGGHMDITITPKKLSGPITPPPSKSQAHRLIITKKV